MPAGPLANTEGESDLAELRARVEALELGAALAERRKYFALQAFILPALVLRLGLGFAWQGVAAWGGPRARPVFALVAALLILLWLTVATRVGDREAGIRDWNVYQLIRKPAAVIKVLALIGVVVALVWAWHTHGSNL